MNAATSGERIPRHRWWIGILLGSGILVNYFDRINLSVAGPQLQHDFGLNAAQLGWLFSAFFWSYAVVQIPTGLILDRFLSRLSPRSDSGRGEPSWILPVTVYSS